MTTTPRTLKLIGGGLAVAVAATLISLQVATFQVANNTADLAQSTAWDAAGAAFILRSGNESVSDRFQTRAVGDSFIAVIAVNHPHGYDTLSMTYENVDGSPVIEGGFSLLQTENGLRVVIRENTPPGEYRVVIDQLTPSEIDHDLIFYVTVTDAEGKN